MLIGCRANFRRAASVAAFCVQELYPANENGLKWIKILLMLTLNP